MNKKNLRILSLILCVLLIAVSAAACSARSSATATDSAEWNYSKGGMSGSTGIAAPQASMPAESPAMENDMVGGVRPESPAADAGTGIGATPVIPAGPNQKIIFSVYLSMETTKYDGSIKIINDITAEFGGYVQSSNISGQGINNYNSQRFTNYILRIPAANLNGFLAKIPTAGSITRQQNSGEDVSDSYFDIEAHLKTLKTTEERLLSLLEKTGELKDIIELENALSKTRYEIESLEGQIRRLDSYISYSTVTIDLYEVMKYTPVNELPKTLGERISLRFNQSVRSIVNGFENFSVWLIGGSPVLLLTLLILGLIVLAAMIIIKLAVRGANKARAKSVEKYRAIKAEYDAAAPVKGTSPAEPSQEDEDEPLN